MDRVSGCPTHCPLSRACAGPFRRRRCRWPSLLPHSLHCSFVTRSRRTAGAGTLDVDALRTRWQFAASHTADLEAIRPELELLEAEFERERREPLEGLQW